MPPDVSVVIPTYNSAALLKKAVQSVFNQIYQNFEVIVINNFSTDDTVDVINSFKDERIKLINLDNEGIIGKSRNIGIKESKGGWIAFLDSDDLWDSGKLEECMKATTEHPEAILFAHKLRNIKGGELIGVNELGSPPHNMYESLLFDGNKFATSSVVAKKFLLEKAGGFSERPDFAGVEDYDLWMRLSKLGKFYFVNSVLGDYLIHDANFSSDIQTRADHWLNVLESHFKELPSDKKFKRKIKAGKANVMFNAGWNNLKIGNFSESRKWFYKSFKTHPLSIKLYAGLLLSLFGIRVSTKLNRLAIKVNNMARR
jgi:glycosyltransferase involved in cell wall biosynthesis